MRIREYGCRSLVRFLYSLGAEWSLWCYSWTLACLENDGHSDDIWSCSLVYTSRFSVSGSLFLWQAHTSLSTVRSRYRGPRLPLVVGLCNLIVGAGVVHLFWWYEVLSKEPVMRMEYPVIELLEEMTNDSLLYTSGSESSQICQNSNVFKTLSLSSVP